MAHDGGVVVVMAVVGPPALNGAVPERALVPSAINYGQADGTFRRAEFRAVVGAGRRAAAQLLAHHLGVLHGPVGVRHCAPAAPQLHLQSPLAGSPAGRQPQLQRLRAGHPHVPLVAAEMPSPAEVVAVLQGLLRSPAVEGVQPDASLALPEGGERGRPRRGPAAQLPAHHAGPTGVPVEVVGAHGAPLALVLHFHPPGAAVAAVHQPQTDGRVARPRGRRRRRGGLRPGCKPSAQPAQQQPQHPAGLHPAPQTQQPGPGGEI